MPPLLFTFNKKDLEKPNIIKERNLEESSGTTNLTVSSLLGNVKKYFLSEKFL